MSCWRDSRLTCDQLQTLERALAVITLDTMQARVSGYSEQLTTVQEALSALGSALESGLTWPAISLTSLLPWLACSELAVLLLGWRAFTGREIRRRQQRAPVQLAGGLQ